MTKRASDLEKEAAQLLETAKRLRAEKETYTGVLDADLLAWKTNLSELASKTASGKEWKLVFFSSDYWGREYVRHGYGPSPWTDQVWSSEEWDNADSNTGGQTIAFANQAENLFPPPQAAKRLLLFGFTFGIFPIGTVIPKKWENLYDNDVSPYVYGLNREFSLTRSRESITFPEESDPLLAMPGKPGEQADLQNSEHVDYFYKLQQQRVSRSKYNEFGSFEAQILGLERDIASLREKKAKVDEIWKARIILD